MYLNRGGIINYLYRQERKIKIFFVIFYFVGLMGIVIPDTRRLFIDLIPFVLLLSFFAVTLFHQPSFDKKTIVLFILIFLISYFIEVIGVHTQLIFGNYFYGNGLGIKLLSTPVMIGINWIMLVYCTASIADKLSIHPLVKIGIASVLMLIYDIIMEHVAPYLDMWYWKGDAVPLQNYFAWFILAFLFQSLIRWAGIKILNRMAATIFVCQALLFVLLIVFFYFAK